MRLSARGVYRNGHISVIKSAKNLPVGRLPGTPLLERARVVAELLQPNVGDLRPHPRGEDMRFFLGWSFFQPLNTGLLLGMRPGKSYLSKLGAAVRNQH